MTATPHISEDRLQILLDDVGSSWSNEEREHLEECRKCQGRLEYMAADPHVWQDVVASLRNATKEPSAFLSGIDPALQSWLQWQGHGETSSTRSAMLQAPRHPELLGSIDQYDIEGFLGQGGMGVVFKGFDRALHRPVAIKFLAPHLAANGVARQRFHREARAAAAVAHPNVVPIYAINSGLRPYLVMALVAGRSLQCIVESDGALGTSEVVRLGIQIAAGLAAAHKQGLIHRDIKPGNILEDGGTGRVMITDFGLARAADDVAVTQTGWLAGTPHYMSPEQARGNELDGRSDLFSLGSVLYFLATGREPFRAEKPLAILDQICHQQPKPPRSIHASVDHVLSTIIERLMEKRPQDRFNSADEVHEILERYLVYLQQPNEHTRPRPYTTSRARQRFIQQSLTWSVIALVLLGIPIWIYQNFGSMPSQHPQKSLPPANDQSPWVLDLLPPDQFDREKQSIAEGIATMESRLLQHPYRGDGDSDPISMGSPTTLDERIIGPTTNH